MNTVNHHLSSSKTHLLDVVIHIFCWILIICFPILIPDNRVDGDGFNWYSYFRRLTPFLICAVVFYVNYGVFMPRYAFNNKWGRYLLCNILLVVVMAMLMHYSTEWFHHRISVDTPPMNPHRVRPPMGRVPPSLWKFVVRDFIVLVFIVPISSAFRMSREWSKAETARRVAENERIEAELKNLRNQLNPHFLLNTLNNIYALIAFDADKAQLAVVELGKLLRHVLYENHQRFVPLSQEVEFIRNYIELMRIRLNKEVAVDVNIDIPSDCTQQIAPLIFISLIENAFKHGISPTHPSFVSIELKADGHDVVHCVIRNSNYPKKQTDKSGNGIGLEQVRWRLELLYPNHYRWQSGVDDTGKVYCSDLKITTRPTPSSLD